jgi:hypothetical protein
VLSCRHILNTLTKRVSLAFLMLQMGIERHVLIAGETCLPVNAALNDMSGFTRSCFTL